MGMFGGSAPAASAAFNPSAMTGGDKLMMLGAMLKDGVSSYNGGDGGNVIGLRGMLSQQQMMRSLMGAMGDQGGGQPAPGATQAAPPSAPEDPSAMFGNGIGRAIGTVPTPVAPTAPPIAQRPSAALNPRVLQILALTNPQAARALVEQQKLQGEIAVGPDGQAYRKYDPSLAGHVFANPANVNNTVVNMNDPGNINRVIPSAPVPGALPIQDEQGRVLDWRLPPGAQQAIIAAQAPAIDHNRAMERIGSYEAGTGRLNAGTQAAAQSNTASQNVVAPPPGFVIRTRKR